MDPISAMLAGWRAGGAIGRFLAEMDAVLTVVNKSKWDVNLAMCFGNVQDSSSAGWTTIPAGNTYARELKIPRAGMDVAFYGEAVQRPSMRWTGDCVFYVVHESGFQVRDARATCAALVSGNGRMATVSGHLVRMGGNFTYTLT